MPRCLTRRAFLATGAAVALGGCSSDGGEIPRRYGYGEGNVNPPVSYGLL